jgi:hypothetical protein
MIHEELPRLPLWYAGVLLAAVLLLWLLSGWRRERRRRRERRGLFQCRLCAEWIRDSAKSRLARCPACGALNEPQPTNDI